MNRLEIMEQVVTCEACELHQQCTAPVMGTIPDTVKVAILGEAPGQQEDAEGAPFIGPAGQLLRAMLTEAGFDLDTVAFINTVSCYPHGTPTWDHIRACADNKAAQLALAKPRLVIPVGKVAIKGVKPYLDVKHGRGRPFVHDGMVFCATYHPAAALRNGNYERAMEQDLQTAAAMLAADDGEPWDEWPSWVGDFLLDNCAACPVEMFLIDSDGLGWCEVHMPEHMAPRLAAYRERYPA